MNELSKYSLGNPNPFDNPIIEELAKILWPSYPVIANNNWPFLQFVGSLSEEQSRALEMEQPLPFAGFSDYQKQFIVGAILFTDESGGELDSGSLQDGSKEITESLPIALAYGFVTVTESSSPIVFFNTDQIGFSRRLLGGVEYGEAEAAFKF